jgi:ABC-type ATPase with predicted acetyltransferase domain
VIRTQASATSKSRAVHEAFGLGTQRLSHELISALSLEIPARGVLLIAGPSGSGKTLLLGGLTSRGSRRALRNRNVTIDGDVILPKGVRIGRLRPFASHKPLIELYGGKDVARAIYALNAAGLSDPYLYLKCFQELSAGQQYRAMIARLIDGDRNLWIADEFCSMLDSISAAIVAHNIRRLAQKYGATVILAAAHWQHLLAPLAPDAVLYLMPGRGHRIFSGTDFAKAGLGL